MAGANPGGMAEVTMAGCEQRTLVLTAFPAEADAVLAHTMLEPNPVGVYDRQYYYRGSIAGKKVLVAMTGIGLVNATRVTEAALNRFTCSSGMAVGAVLFSGVAGGAGRTSIGDVAVPAQWTVDNGTSYTPVDPGMLAVAQALTVNLSSVNNLGNPMCLCRHVPTVKLIDLKRVPQLFVGGNGYSHDSNNGQAFPCVPNTGDVFGCQPCSPPGRSLLYSGNFFQAIGPFLAKGLLSNLNIQTAENPAFDAVDQETAAALAVATKHSVPFLGIRGMSDGPGDPLGLPGFPFQFFFYKQIAAENAARVVEAFMTSWTGP
ncbi:phosphorylase family protein [Mycobacterium asiaticum]|uniref:phosphorylase family protein n=1 Tax=Mycobacterium asiaticum TaxID=1790 RepID=UPI000ADC6AB6|nr:hypothetical protein [Mycobacterium asiaticum]